MVFPEKPSQLLKSQNTSYTILKTLIENLPLLIYLRVVMCLSHVMTMLPLVHLVLSVCLFLLPPLGFTRTHFSFLLEPLLFLSSRDSSFKIS